MFSEFLVLARREMALKLIFQIITSKLDKLRKMKHLKKYCNFVFQRNH